MKILVVDDSRTMRKILRNALEGMGYSAASVIEASDGVEAMGRLREHRFKIDIILVDWNMPNMDGITFVKTYRGQGNKTPIIMVTTENEKARVVEAIKAGVDNYVVKPFTPEVLGERINDTMAKVESAP